MIFFFGLPTTATNHFPFSPSSMSLAEHVLLVVSQRDTTEIVYRASSSGSSGGADDAIVAALMPRLKYGAAGSTLPFLFRVREGDAVLDACGGRCRDPRMTVCMVYKGNKHSSLMAVMSMLCGSFSLLDREATLARLESLRPDLLSPHSRSLLVLRGCTPLVAACRIDEQLAIPKTSTYPMSMLFHCFAPDQIRLLLSAYLQSGRIIFFSRTLDVASCCAVALLGLMKPFPWPHHCYPLLDTDDLLDIIDDPKPFICGSHCSNIPRVLLRRPGCWIADCRTGILGRAPTQPPGSDDVLFHVLPSSSGLKEGIYRCVSKSTRTAFAKWTEFPLYTHYPLQERLGGSSQERYVSPLHISVEAALMRDIMEYFVLNLVGNYRKGFNFVTQKMDPRFLHGNINNSDLVNRISAAGPFNEWSREVIQREREQRLRDSSDDFHPFFEACIRNFPQLYPESSTEKPSMFTKLMSKAQKAVKALSADSVPSPVLFYDQAGRFGLEISQRLGTKGFCLPFDAVLSFEDYHPLLEFQRTRVSRGSATSSPPKSTNTAWAVEDLFS
jgi:hypothetical protein